MYVKCARNQILLEYFFCQKISFEWACEKCSFKLKQTYKKHELYFKQNA